MSTKLLILKHTVPIYHVIPWSKRAFLFGFNMLVKNYYKCTYFNLIHLVNSLLMIFKIWYFTNMKFISLVCVGSILTNEVNNNWRIAQFFFFYRLLLIVRKWSICVKENTNRSASDNILFVWRTHRLKKKIQLNSG